MPSGLRRPMRGTALRRMHSIGEVTARSDRTGVFANGRLDRGCGVLQELAAVSVSYRDAVRSGSGALWIPVAVMRNWLIYKGSIRITGVCLKFCKLQEGCQKPCLRASR